MAIYKLIHNAPLGPDEIQRLVNAYNETLRALGLKDRDDPLTGLVARKVFEIAQTGIGDPAAGDPVHSPSSFSCFCSRSRRRSAIAVRLGISTASSESRCARSE